MEDLMAEFLKARHIAVIGSLKDGSKIACRIVKRLLEKKYRVYPVNPGVKELEGLKVYPSAGELPPQIQAVNLVTPPKASLELIKELKPKGVNCFWLQPGAENQEIIDFCTENQVPLIYGQCLLLKL